ncbi:hypothetical protein K435DRAFT_881183 [Dendrothele bispora CBS 962.96]|uniref:F-box domain-containing protein n=1 Tax=Dendrothele bispora (strain CBS 962.96) TaxID=1314807 RepID=A0A4S8KJK6_DENBC|nr:hypothetical protein K435DRAFT_881183 [Dendrothele bispora CBS 962.96]
MQSSLFRIPPELTDSIIDKISPTDALTLQSCALVSRNWRVKSQSRLFHKHLFLYTCRPQRDYKEDTLKYIEEFFDTCSSSHIMNAVEGITIPRFALLKIHGFKNLETLSILHLDGSDDRIFTEKDCPSALIRQNPRLNKFELYGGYFDMSFLGAALVELDSHKPPLFELRLERCHFTKKSNLAPFEYIFNQVKLVVRSVTNLDTFVTGLNLEGLSDIVVAEGPGKCGELDHLLNKYGKHIRYLTVEGLHLGIGSSTSN